jgi:ribosome-binding factor A
MERIGRLMQQSIGRMLFSHLSDPRIDPGKTTVTRVQVQEDLLRAKVFISVMGTPSEGRLTIQALNHAAGRVQSMLREEVKLRNMPLLEFVPDEQYKTALKTWDIIRQAMNEIHEKEERQAASTQGPDAAQDEGKTENEE